MVAQSRSEIELRAPTARESRARSETGHRGKIMGFRGSAARWLHGLAFVALVGGIVWALRGPGGGGWHVAAFAVMPDIALFVGMAPGLAKGQLHPRAVPLYNALHSVVGLLLLAVVSMIWLGTPWLAGALAWGAHIAMDRAVGYGPRTREGFQRA